jgi:hypothetical protein
VSEQQITKWWEAEFDWRTGDVKFRSLDVVKETESFLTFMVKDSGWHAPIAITDRTKKSTEFHTWHRTKREALAHLTAACETRIKRSSDELERFQEKLAKCLAVTLEASE